MLNKEINKEMNKITRRFWCYSFKYTYNNNYKFPNDITILNIRRTNLSKLFQNIAAQYQNMYIHILYGPGLWLTQLK